jgi:hypothetical protein
LKFQKRQTHIFFSIITTIGIFTLVATAARYTPQEGFLRPLNSPQVEEFKVAVFGDTGAGADFKQVLALAKKENANLIMINGDFGYGPKPAAWAGALLKVIDPDQIGVIGSLGNHDVLDRVQYLKQFKQFRTEKNQLNKLCTGQPKIEPGPDIIAVDEVCTFGNVSIVASGIGQVLTKDYLTNKLSEKLEAAPAANWKLVGYHFTLESMTPGLKPDQNTHSFFDLIRKHGAIGAQAHTHSAMASCPIYSQFKKGNPVLCHPEFGKDLEDRFIAPGIGMFLDSSLGGKDVRPRKRCKNPNESGCEHMVDLITADGYTRTDGTKITDFTRDGSMFIVFNKNRNPNLAEVYFKSVDNTRVFEFTIRR